jgi:hypothetical protein
MQVDSLQAARKKSLLSLRNTLRMKSSGNAKAIDFYAGLKLDGGPLNPNRKTWKEAVREEMLYEEKSSVQSLKDW